MRSREIVFAGPNARRVADTPTMKKHGFLGLFGRKKEVIDLQSPKDIAPVDDSNEIEHGNVIVIEQAVVPIEESNHSQIKITPQPIDGIKTKQTPILTRFSPNDIDESTIGNKDKQEIYINEDSIEFRTILERNLSKMKIEKKKNSLTEAELEIAKNKSRLEMIEDSKESIYYIALFDKIDDKISIRNGGWISSESRLSERKIEAEEKKEVPTVYDLSKEFDIARLFELFKQFADAGRMIQEFYPRMKNLKQIKYSQLGLEELLRKEKKSIIHQICLSLTAKERNIPLDKLIQLKESLSEFVNK